jgi:integrase
MAIELIKGDGWKTVGAPGKINDGGGLFLDVRSPTSASWLFKFTLGGKQDEMGLGSRNKVGIERARELRRWAQDEVNALRNPKAKLKTAKLEAVRAVNAPKAQSVHALAKDHVTLIAKELKTERGRKEWVRSLHSDFIGYVADMAPGDVTAEDVKPLLEKLYKATPVLADHIRQRLAKVLSWAKATGRIVTPDWENPVRWENNLEHVLNRGERDEKHHAALPAFRVGKFLSVLRDRADTSLAMRLALEWHVISATRPGEAAATDWAWFDWANHCIVYPASVMKMRRPHRVPLTTRHDEILDALLGGAEPPQAGPVFSVRVGSPVSVTGLRKALLTVDKTGATLHGFRSSFATWARAETYPVTLPSGELRRVRLYDEALIEECLAHVVGGAVRNAYVRDDFLELRRGIMQAWATYCGKVVEASEVTPMRGRAAVKLAA